MSASRAGPWQGVTTADLAHDRHFPPPWVWGAVLEGGHSGLVGRVSGDWAHLLLGMRAVFLPPSLLGQQAAKDRPAQISRFQEPLGPLSPVLSPEPREPGGLEPGALAGLSELPSLLPSSTEAASQALHPRVHSGSEGGLSLLGPQRQI